jgi:16S rRNA (cytidine1402-2'-O)-methyltransferase
MVSHRAPVEARSLGRLLGALESGDVALVSDAGTPTLSDPGRLLISSAWEAGHRVVPVPGPSSVTAALAAAGFKSDGFIFAGYLPRKPGELRRFFAALADSRRQVVAFESPHRIRKSLEALAATLPERQVAVARELTKVHEEILRGTAAEVRAQLREPVRGEVTLVVAPGAK